MKREEQRGTTRTARNKKKKTEHKRSLGGRIGTATIRKRNRKGTHKEQTRTQHLDKNRKEQKRAQHGTNRNNKEQKQNQTGEERSRKEQKGT